MRIALIPNGVDVERFHPLEETTTTGERTEVAVCVARMRYEKGIDVLLQAWSIVQRELPQARLVLVGRGQFKRHCKKWQRPWVLQRALSLWDCRKMCQRSYTAGRWPPSLALGGAMNALLEEMACGLACVATRVSGSEDAIQHGVNGLLVEPEDYRGMAQALLTLLRDPALARIR